MSSTGLLKSLATVTLLFSVLAPEKSLAQQNSSIKIQTLYPWFNGIESWEPSAELMRDISSYLSGFDYDQRVVHVSEIGRWNVKKYALSSDVEAKLNYTHRIQKSVYSTMEEVINISETEGNDEQVVLVLDFAGLQTTEAFIPDVSAAYIQNMRLMSSFLDYFFAIYCVNVNAVTVALLETVRTLLPNLYAKATVIGTNQEKIIATLRSNIPKDQLPPWYGGSKDFQPYKLL